VQQRVRCGRRIWRGDQPLLHAIRITLLAVRAESRRKQHYQSATASICLTPATRPDRIGKRKRVRRINFQRIFL
jgi:hypothetical protein